MPAAPTTDDLCALAGVIDEAFKDDFDGPHALVRVADVETPGEFDLGIKALEPGEHPVDVLLGFVAPEDWTVLGIVSFGWAAPLDGLRPSKHPKKSRVRAVQLIARDGTEAAIMRTADGAEPVPLSSGRGPIAQGNVPDCIRRCLDLPTAAPETPTAHLRAVRWLTAIAARGHPSYNGEKLRWPELTSMLELIPERSWEEERWAALSAEGFGGEISATEAAWMDAGMFSRWVRVSVGEPYELMADAKAVCSNQAWKKVQAELYSWGVPLRRLRAVS